MGLSRGLLSAGALSIAMLGGCTFGDVSPWPSLTGGDPAGGAGAGAAAGGLVLGASSFVPAGVTPGQPTGTVVGQQVEAMRGHLTAIQQAVLEHNSQLQQIRAETIASAARYHTRVAEIETRLQVGTTPGNPELVALWNEAQTNLETLSAGITGMTGLSTAAANTSASSAYLLANARAAYGLTGAVDEDHLQLAVLEDETNQTVVLIDRLLTEVSEDLGRQTAYLGRERENLRLLSVGVINGELFGRSLANAAYGVAPLASAPPPGVAATRPLMIIRFDQSGVEYAQALYSAASSVINVRPNAQFELVAVAPLQPAPAQQALRSTDARRNAEDVRRTLAQFGIPPQRVALSEASSSAAVANEVHIYVR